MIRQQTKFTMFCDKCGRSMKEVTAERYYRKEWFGANKFLWETETHMCGTCQARTAMGAACSDSELDRT